MEDIRSINKERVKAGAKKLPVGFGPAITERSTEAKEMLLSLMHLSGSQRNARASETYDVNGKLKGRMFGSSRVSATSNSSPSASHVTSCLAGVASGRRSSTAVRTRPPGPAASRVPLPSTVECLTRGWTMGVVLVLVVDPTGKGRGVRRWLSSILPSEAKVVINIPLPMRQWRGKRRRCTRWTRKERSTPVWAERSFPTIVGCKS